MSSKEIKETACCRPECCQDDETETATMQDPHEIKNIVKERYSKIATQSKEQNVSSCCGIASSEGESSGCCNSVDYAVFAEDYTKLKGYNKDADLGLGCGVPTEFAQIKEGDTVVDLGSGAGNDVFVARAITGETGKVIGVDFTMAMIKKAEENKKKLGFENVEFKYGDIEKLPIEDSSVDVVISNCVLNLVPNKAKAFAEIYRILKPGGHLSVSDVVSTKELPINIKTAANLYAGCVGGAIIKEEYIGIMKNAGLVNIDVQKERVINVPDEIMLEYVTLDELKAVKDTNIDILSINVYAEKK